MELKHLLIITAIIAIIYGLGQLLVPESMGSLHGAQIHPSATLMAQYLGGALIGVGLLAWFVRNVPDPGTQRGLIVSFLIYHIIGAIVSIIGIVSGVINAMGWVPVGIYLILALGYAYFLLQRIQTSS